MIPLHISVLIDEHERLLELRNDRDPDIQFVETTMLKIEAELRGILWATKETIHQLRFFPGQASIYSTNHVREMIIEHEEIISTIQVALGDEQ